MTTYKVIPEELDGPVVPANEVGSEYILIMYADYTGGSRRTAQRERRHASEQAVWVVRDEDGLKCTEFDRVQDILQVYNDVQAIPKDDIFTGGF